MCEFWSNAMAYQYILTHQDTAGRKSVTTERARYERMKGFICSKGNHVLYCPDLTKADKSMPFYLYCSRHNMMYEIDIPTQGSEFTADFPHGSRESE
jgi:hypothetical protein